MCVVIFFNPEEILESFVSTFACYVPWFVVYVFRLLRVSSESLSSVQMQSTCELSRESDFTKSLPAVHVQFLRGLVAAQDNSSKSLRPSCRLTFNFLATFTIDFRSAIVALPRRRDILEHE